MHLIWPTILLVLSAHGTNGINNDIVGTMRCRLLCKEADGYASEMKEQGICKCNVLKKLSDKQLLKVQELSTYYNLPVVFQREYHNYKVKRQLDDNLLEDWRAKMGEQWANAADSIKTWGDQQRRENPILSHIEEHAEKLKAFQEQARDNRLFGNMEEHADNWKAYQDQLKDSLGDLEDHAENLQAWHQDAIDSMKEGLQDQKEKVEENLAKLQSLDLTNLAAEQAEQLKSFHEEHIEPLLGDIPAQIAEIEQQMEKLKTIQVPGMVAPMEPVLGQMAPSLVNYASTATGIGGSNVNYPAPTIPNPYIPPMAHFIHTLPIPRINLNAAPAPIAARPVFPLVPGFPAPPFPQVFSRSMAGPALPANYVGPYDPRNPIVVRPIIVPNHGQPAPKPILSGLRNTVDDMLANVKKSHGRLLPGSYGSSDALSNSESQVNQINVNVRMEPSSTVPNLYSVFFPNRTPWLAAPAPQNVDAHAAEVTENPGAIDSDASAEQEDLEEERRMEKQLKDANRSEFNAHVVDSVKRNLGAKGTRQRQDDGEDDAATYGNGLIVQPKQFMQDSQEDLETLA